MKIINPTALLNAMNSCKVGQFGELSANDFEIEFEKIKPIEGYEPLINKDTGEHFPNCCNWHKSIYEYASKWFETFPNCCEYHKKLIGQHWFNKSNYKEAVNKIINQLAYTEHCIDENINKQNWYKSITDYIEWNYSSFGQLPKGYGTPVGLDKYLQVLKQYIQNTTNEIPKEKRQQLIEFIEDYYNPVEAKQTDLNILNTVYQKWIEIFPFDLSYFAKLKTHFEKQLPFVTGKPEVNKYTGIAKVKIHTKSSLINALLNLTNSLITQINSHSLYEKGLLTEPQKIKLELIINERKLKLEQGYVNNSQNEETRYRKILKEWFKDEKAFIEEITPLLQSLPPQPIRTKLDILKENLQEGGFYNLDKVKNLSETGQNKLVELINKSMAYGIAMFDYLGFCTFLDIEKKVKYKANQYLSKLYNENAKDGTQAKHYRNSLINNKPRYTSYLHKEKVIKDYEQLK